MWRQAGPISPEIAQLDAKYKDPCPYYPSPVLCSSRAMVGKAFDEGARLDSAPREIIVNSEMRPEPLELGSWLRARFGVFISP